MAILVLFEAAGVTQAKYDQVSREVLPGNKPAAGLLYHVAAPTADGFRVVEVWESQASMDKFFQSSLRQALQNASISVQPQIAAVHNVVQP